MVTWISDCPKAGRRKELFENLVQGAISDSLFKSNSVAPLTLLAAAISKEIDCEFLTVLVIRIVLVVDRASDVTSHNLRFCEYGSDLSALLFGRTSMRSPRLSTACETPRFKELNTIAIEKTRKLLISE
jgi:hypothetical protein